MRIFLQPTQQVNMFVGKNWNKKKEKYKKTDKTIHCSISFPYP